MRRRTRHVRPLLDTVAGAITFVGVILLPLIAVACDPNDVTSTAQKVIFDVTTCKFTAERHFVAEFDGQRVDYVERVRSAGDGTNIEIELTALNGKRRGQITDSAEAEWFDRLARQLQAGGGPRALFQRDPRIDDLTRLVENYYISPVELSRAPVRPGGEPVLTFLLEPHVHDRPFYVLTVSTAHGREGFPIQCQEYIYDVAGPRLVSDMTVTKVRFGDSDGQVVTPTSPIVSRTAYTDLDSAAARAALHGVQLLLPKDGALPQGFALVRIEEVVMKTAATKGGLEIQARLFRFVWSDGVEHIEFIEHAPTDFVPGGLAGKSLLDLVTIYRFGSIEVATVLHEGTQVVIESRVAADRFHSLVKNLVRY